MKIACGDELAEGAQRLVDPADDSTLPQGKLVWQFAPGLERQVQLCAQFWFELEDLPCELLDDGFQSGHRVLWCPRPQ